MPYVYRVEVVDPTSHNILITDEHASLPEDQNWAKTGKAIQGNKVLFHHDQRGQAERPFAFLGREGKWYLDVEVRDVPSNFVSNTIAGLTNLTGGLFNRGAVWRLIFRDANTHASKHLSGDLVIASATAYPDGNSAVFRYEFTAEAPYGLFGEYDFKLELCEESQPRMGRIDPVELGKISLEAYYLSAPSLPSYFNNGVPLLLLRMFILPQRFKPGNGTSKNDAAAWVHNVTSITFGSQTPFTRQISRTEDHWLSYNATGGGAPSFTGKYGFIGLDINAWLDAYRNWDTHQVITHVNCYDQAGITEIALCLGLHHEQVHWEYHQPYGFIEADLVGWGHVNCPFFDGVKTFKTYEKNDAARSPFRNHAYLSWTKERIPLSFYEKFNKAMNETSEDYLTAATKLEQEQNTQFYMIDACAGPHCGTETRREYESKVEHVADPSDSTFTYVKESYKSDPSNWDAEHVLGAGITKWFNGLPDSKKADYALRVKKLSELITLDYRVGVEIHLIVARLEASFKNFVVGSMMVKWKNHLKMYSVRPYDTKNGTRVEEFKISYSTREDLKMNRAASLRVAYNKVSEAARTSLAEHLAFQISSADAAQTKIKDRGKIGRDDKTVNVVGTYYNRAFLWHEVAVDVTIEDDDFWTTNDNKLLANLLASLVEMTTFQS